MRLRTGVISDLHLGTRTRNDVLRDPRARARLLGRLAGCDQLVLLGDAIELRDRPAAEALEVAAPFLAAVGSALGGGRVVLVPGNHDHRLAHEALDLGRRRRGEGLPLVREVPARATGVAAAIRRALGTELVIAYPGFAIADGVWATHGHYLDAHSRALTLECTTAAVLAAVRRRTHGSLRRPEDYEAVLAPSYTLYFHVAQQPRLRRSADAGKEIVRRVETRLGARGPGRRPGIGPFTRVLEGLGVEAEHVLFGHTHRTGPLPGEDRSAWRTAGGVALWNTGSWVHEPAHVGPEGSRSACWPGTFTTVEGSGRPTLHRLLEDFAPESC